MQLFASGWTEAQVLESYPHLKAEDLQAVFAFVHDCIKDDTFIMNSVLVAEAANPVATVR